MQRIIGTAAPKDFIAMMMSRQRNQAEPYSRANIIRPFNPQAVTNPSRDIQRKYLSPPADIKPFDACAAQRRKEEAIREGEPAADPEAYSLVSFMIKNRLQPSKAIEQYYAMKEKGCEAMKPEYWGMRWEDLTETGVNRWVNPDGLRFPPVQWRDPTTGRIYWALACCGGKPEEEGKRNRYTMLYFKEGDAPTIETKFKETAARKQNKRNEAERVPPIMYEPPAYVLRKFIERQEQRQANGQLPEGEAANLPEQRQRLANMGAAGQQQIARYEAYLAAVEAARANIGTDVKTYRGVQLQGTDAVKARTEQQVTRQRARKGQGPMPRMPTMSAEQRKGALKIMRKGIDRYKQTHPNAGKCEAPEEPAPGPMPQLMVQEVEQPAAAAAPEMEAGQPLQVRDLPEDEVRDAELRSVRAYARAVRATKVTRFSIRDAYNASRKYGSSLLKRMAYAVGVPREKELKDFGRRGPMSAIAKYAPYYDINTDAKKASNGDILELPPLREGTAPAPNPDL